MAGTPKSIKGARRVDNLEQADRVRNVSPVILMLQDDKKSLMTYLSGLGSESTDNYEFEWITDEIIPNRGTLGAALVGAANNAAETVNLAGLSTNVYVRRDEQLYFPVNGEIMRVVTTPTNMNATAVLRNVASATASGAIAAGSLWINIGDARGAMTRLYTEHAGSSADVLSVDKTFKKNYTQTFEEAIASTRRSSKSKRYSGKEESQEKTKALMQHLEKIEHAFWFGKPYPTTLDNERTATGGVLHFLPDGVNETVADLTQEAFDDFVLRTTRYGNKRRRVLFCSRHIATKISQWAYNKQRVQSTGSSVKYGVHIETVKTAGGVDVDIVTCDALESIPGVSAANARGHDGTAVLMDMTGKKKVVFGGDDLTYAEGLENPDQIGDKLSAYLSDVGYKPGDARKDGLITDTALST